MVFGKKAQGLSITTIIVAAIALIVLVVLIAIFTGRIGGFGAGVDSVTQNKCLDVAGGECVASTAQCPVGKIEAFGKSGCLEAAPKCCVPG